MRPQALGGDAHEAAVRDRLQVLGRRAEIEPARRRPGGSAARPAAHRARAPRRSRPASESVPSRRRSSSRHAGSACRPRRRAVTTSTSSAPWICTRLPAPFEAPGRERRHRRRGARRRQRRRAAHGRRRRRRSRRPRACPSTSSAARCACCRASRRAPDSRGPRAPGGPDRSGWAGSRASEPKALIEPWASPIRMRRPRAPAPGPSRRSDRRARGGGRAAPAAAGPRRRPSATGAGSRCTPTFVRQAAAQHALPRPARLVRVVVARDQVPAHARDRRASARAAGRACGPRRSRRRRCRPRPARSARRARQRQPADGRDRLQARLLQHAHGGLVDEAEDLADLPVGGVDQAHRAALNPGSVITADLPATRRTTQDQMSRREGASERPGGRSARARAA